MMAKQMQKINDLIKTREKKNIALAYQLASSTHQLEVFSAYEMLTDPEDSRHLVEKVYDLFEEYRFEIDLSGKRLAQGLTELPEVIYAFPDITDLNLSDNKLTHLPEELKIFKKLKCLELARNQFDHFPTIILSLYRLSNLALDHNYITNLPEEMGQLTALRFLSLNENQISILPQSLSSLKELYALHLDNNRFSQWPTVLDELSLSRLSLSGNVLTEVPASFDLTSIGEFDISHNPIETLSATRIPEHAALSSLQVEGTKLPEHNLQEINRALEKVRRHRLRKFSKAAYPFFKIIP